MSNARLFSAIALTAVVTGTLVAGLTLSRPAHADPAGTAVCIAGAEPGENFRDGAGAAAKATAMFNGHLAEGRTRVAVIPVVGSGTSVTCFW